MKNINIILIVILLILTLLNFDYDNLKNFEFTKSVILDVLLIVLCIGALIYYLKKGSKNNVEHNND